MLGLDHERRTALDVIIVCLSDFGYLECSLPYIIDVLADIYQRADRRTDGWMERSIYVAFSFCEDLDIISSDTP